MKLIIYFWYLVLLSYSLIQSIIYKEAKIKNIPYYQLLFFNNVIFYLVTLISYKLFYSKDINEYNDDELDELSNDTNILINKEYQIKNFKWVYMSGYKSEIKQFFYIGKLFKTLVILNCITLYTGVFTYMLDISIVYSLYTIQYLIIILYNIYNNQIIKNYLLKRLYNNSIIIKYDNINTDIDDNNINDNNISIDDNNISIDDNDISINDNDISIDDNDISIDDNDNKLSTKSIINTKIEMISLIRNIIIFCILLVSFIYSIESFIHNNYNISHIIFIILYICLIILSSIRDILKYKNNKLIKKYDIDNGIITYNINQIDLKKQNNNDQLEFPVLYYIDKSFISQKIIGKRINDNFITNIITCIDKQLLKNIWDNNFTVHSKRLLLLLIIKNVDTLNNDCDIIIKSQNLIKIIENNKNDINLNTIIYEYYNNNKIYSLLKDKNKLKYKDKNIFYGIVNNFKFFDINIEDSNKIYDNVEKIKFSTIEYYESYFNIFNPKNIQYIEIICKYHNWYYDTHIKKVNKNIINLNNHNDNRLIIFLYKLSKCNIYISFLIFFITFFGINTSTNLNNYNFNPYTILYTIAGSLITYLGIISTIVIPTQINSNTFTILTIIRRIPLLFIATFMYNENIDNNLWISIYIQIGVSIFDIIFKQIINILY